jgi:signal transduction histidine kinase
MTALERPAAGAVSAATLAFGVSALGVAVVLVLLRAAYLPADSVWPALGFLVPIALLMLVARRRLGWWATALHLAVAAVCIGGYSAVILTESGEAVAESPFILALPQLAVIYTVAPSVMGMGNLVAIAAAYLLGQGAVLVAAATAGRFPAFDGFTAVLTAVVLAVGVADLVTRRGAERDSRSVERARREADALAYQREVEAQVVALFHDTVLGELTLISHLAPGPLPPGLADALRRDLALIETGRLWPEEHSAGPGRAVDGIPLPVPLARAVAGGRERGLAIDLAGDLASLQRLAPEVAEAVGLALEQVLVNVHRHAGTAAVEVVVDGAAHEVVLMVSDAGVGFSPEEVGSERFGVQHSILGRIDAAGGRAQLFTAPGSGTAYLFSLPPAPENVWPEPERASG